MRYFIYCLLVLLTASLSAQREEIVRFSVDMTARQDATLDVTETITVVATGNEIRRGITRALHKRPLGTDETLAPFNYEIVGVTRDGEEDNFRVRTIDGLPTVYIGNKDVVLNPGTYTYVLRYRAANQVYPVGATDEIRWPLESRRGAFPIRDADVTIRFDRSLAILQSACYTGRFGSTAEDCEYSQDGHVVTFALTQPLEPGEGMTVAASVPQGYFARPVPPPPPTPFEKNAVLWTVVLGLALSAGYAYTMWRKYGVDPVAETDDYSFRPPAELSPAATAYRYNGYPHQNQVTASLTALATAGYVAITEEEEAGLLTKKEIFTVHPTGRQPATGELPAEQQVLYDGIATSGGLKLDGDYNEEIKNLTEAHQEALKEEHLDFLKDGLSYKGMLPLLGLLAATMGLAGYFLYQTGIGKVPFLIGAFLAILLFGVFGWLIQQPSLAKVTLINRIKGLRRYLKLSEKKRRALPGAPNMTPEHFAELLPFAIALGIDNNWADDLAADWAATGQDQTNNLMLAAPFMAAGFGNRLGNSYEQTAVNPATSDGGGGGGFAGGGGSVGGGGGTGGW